MKRRDFITGSAATLALGLPKKTATEGIPIPSGTTADAEFPFGRSEIKFRLEDMMETIVRREGWKLIAYKDRYVDPAKGDVALIGAGFNLNVAPPSDRKDAGDATPDPYRYNQRTRQDPSTEELWKIAGIPSEKLGGLRENYKKRQRSWYAGAFNLHEDITDEEARRLLYVSTRQAVHNAMAYAKDFPDMNGAQQMGMSQLVYQMGANLQEFGKFLAEVNDTSYHTSPELTAEHWRHAQKELVDSKWYKTYKTRATQVIAMFDPGYAASMTDARDRVAGLANEVKAEALQTKKDGAGQAGFAKREAHKSDDAERGRQ